MKKALLHYHLFKNAGTSLDATLKKNFPESRGKWATKEFPARAEVNRSQVLEWIKKTPQAKCYSSHTAFFPIPKFEDIEIFPIIFLRHPIDRIASAYSFEKKQTTPNFGACVARNTDLAGYIEIRNSQSHDKQCRNFQGTRLATMFGGATSFEEKARNAIEELPFIGVVEHYDQSLELLESLVTNWGLKISLVSMVENSARIGITLEEKLDRIKNDLGQENYAKLEEANALDIQLWEQACKAYI